MNLKVVKEEDKTLIVEIPNESISFANLIKSELWDDPNVREAAYIKEHPYLEEPKVFVKTSRGKPQTALEKAAKRLITQAETFREEFKKALKK